MSSSIHIQEIGIHIRSTAIRNRLPLRLERGEGWGEVSSSIHIQSTGIRSQGIAINIQGIAADNHPTRIYIRATAADSREIAADCREMTVNIEEIAIYRPRNAAATVETPASSGVFDGNNQEINALRRF